MSIVSIIIGILVIGLIIFIHEFGHYLIALKNHVNVPEFWIGFGPKLFSFTKAGTEFSIRPVLFGGACIFDEIDPDEDDDISSDNDKASAVIKNTEAMRLPTDEMLKKQAPWVRLSVLFAGPFFNFLLGFLCSLIVICCVGIDYPLVASVTEGYPAKEAGLESGDLIKEINGEKILTFRDLQLYMSNYNGLDVLNIVYERDTEDKEINIVPRYDEDTSNYYIGISVYSYRVKVTDGLEAIRYSAHDVIYWIKYTVSAIKGLFTGSVPVTSLSGPVGVVSAVSGAVEESSEDGPYYVFLNLCYIIAILSIDIGVMNLLPIPGLDGGRILLVLVELVIGRRIPEKGELAVTLAGVILLFLLMIFVFFNDIVSALATL